MLAQYEAGIIIIFNSFMGAWANQATAGVCLSHGLLILTEHKKCMYNQNVADSIYRQTVCLHVGETTKTKQKDPIKCSQGVHHGNKTTKKNEGSVRKNAWRESFLPENNVS